VKDGVIPLGRTEVDLRFNDLAATGSYIKDEIRRYRSALSTRDLLVMPASLTLPFVQCHQVRGFAESGGLMKPSDNGSRLLWAKAKRTVIKQIANADTLRMRVITVPDGGTS